MRPALGTLGASAQIGGFDSKALSTGSFWSHAGKAKPGEWRQTVERIDEVPSAAPRPCCVPCRVPALAPVRLSRHVLSCVRLAQIGGFDSKALSTNSFWAHAGKSSGHQWRRLVDRVATIGQ
jgi:hypothetical protein